MVTMPESPTPDRPSKLSLRTLAFEDQQRRAIRSQAEMDARKRAEEKRAEFEMKVAVTEKLTDRLPREGMAPVFFAAARRVAMEVLLGNIPIRNGSDAGAAIKALIDAGRIESGQATSVTDDLTLPPKDRQEAERRLATLQDEVARRRQQVASGE